MGAATPKAENVPQEPIVPLALLATFTEFAEADGIGLRIAAVSGTLMMLGMWAAEWPLAKFTSAGEPSMSTNPIVDYHIIYALVLIALALTYAGHTWGLGKRWAKLPFVRRNRWLI